MNGRYCLCKLPVSAWLCKGSHVASELGSWLVHVDPWIGSGQPFDTVFSRGLLHWNIMSPSLFWVNIVLHRHFWLLFSLIMFFTRHQIPSYKSVAISRTIDTIIWFSTGISKFMLTFSFTETSLIEWNQLFDLNWLLCPSRRIDGKPPFHT